MLYIIFNKGEDIILAFYHTNIHQRRERDFMNQPGNQIEKSDTQRLMQILKDKWCNETQVIQIQ